ncbi:hypothetical protein E5F05_09850 [Deinococcus metallilatus]|uniref:Uncharacterized protein n=2 Tax=Deinococcus TaxID=1298 RepID=A0AAJ5JXX6_9DEIO|nr:hypothetical protein [Deinococcus metallilatus]MBB5295953.1 hypothetical protein [Deinococcus metallilatus]QBY08218.1 hypothetical protein E5F05_09850 [Deinococcus metallilatus]RXJ11949.1 hypothetical protein ERJ73_08660 [Deinococcus metallilatus]TLK25819.1 hypothetical protein FCS05_12320 [Deinococcus metallilatus]
MTGPRDDDRTDVPVPPPASDAESATKFPYPTPEQESVVQDSPGTPGVELEGGSMLDEQGNYKPDNLVDDQA